MKKILTLLFAFMAMTFCAKAQTLLSEGFESGTLPAGWTIIDSDGDGYNWSVQSDYSEYSHTGSGLITSASYASIALTPDNWLITPAINLTADATLSFWVAAQDPLWAAENYSVYVATGNTVADFTATTPLITTVPSGVWEQKTFDLSGYTGQTVYIAFRHYNVTDMFRLNLDDITVFAMPTSPTIDVAPLTVDFGNVVLGDTSVRTVNVSGYSLSTDIAATTASPFALSTDGLTFNTTTTIPQAGTTLYIQYIPSQTGEETGSIDLSSTGAANVTVTLRGSGLDCSNNTLPLAQSFEGLTSLQCWTVGSMNAENGIGVNNEYASDGSYCFLFSSVETAASGDYNQYLITPELPNTVNKMITFDYFPYSLLSESFKVGYSTTTNDINDFTWGPVVSVYGSASEVWTTYINDSIPADAKYIAINYCPGSQQYYILIDNIVISEFTDCMPPVSINISNVTQSTASINWTPFGDETAWSVAVVEQGGDPDLAVAEYVTAQPYAVTDLMPSTTYEVYIKAECESGSGNWSVPGSLTTNPDCSNPSNPQVSNVTGTSAVISWTAAPYGVTSYYVEYGEAQSGSTDQIFVDNATTVTLTGLNPQTDYEFTITSDCNSATIIPTPVAGTFSTGCLIGGDVAIGNGTSTSYSIPVNNYYNYSYTQQIFLSSELGGVNDFHSVSFEYDYSSASSNKTNCVIYLGQTTQSSFSSSSNYIPLSSLTQVYSGSLNCHQGWNTFNFDTVFHYDGTSNLVLVVDDNSNNYNGSAYKFKVHTAPGTQTLYFYSDTNNPDPSNPTASGASSATSSDRNNVKFGGECDETSICVAPIITNVTVTSTEATITWSPGYQESAWVLEYKSDEDTVWTNEGSVTSPYIVSNLNTNTFYTFHLYSDCGGDYSIPTTAEVTTLPCDDACVYVINMTDEYGDGWNGNTINIMANGILAAEVTLEDGENASYTYYQCGAAEVSFVWAEGNYPEEASFTITDGGGNTLYTCSNGANLTDGAEFFNNTCGTITCSRPQDVIVSNITTSSAEVAWTETGFATTWNIEYGPTGFTQGQGTTEVATSNPYTISSLNASTNYDIYVQADCGGGDTSFKSDVVRFATECDAVSVPYTENFNSYTTTATGSTAPSNYPNDNMPLCWTFINRVPNTSNYPQVFLSSYSSYAVNGNSLFFKSSSSTPLYAVLPEFTDNISDLALSFSYRNEGTTTSNGTLYVGYMTDPSVDSTFTSVQTCNQTTTITLIEDVLFTNAPAGSYIAFKYQGGDYDNYYLSIDNVSVYVIPTCPKPSNFTVSNVTTSSVELTWTETGTATTWNVAYGPQGFNPDTAVNIEYANDTTIVINNLTAGTSYDFYVQADCGGDYSIWVGPINAVPGSFNMPVTGNATISMCGGTIYDNGGANGNYADNCDARLTVNPETSADLVSISGTLTAESASWDYLVIYDGDGVTELYHSAQSSGTTVTFGPIESTTGPLVVYFHSDGSNNYSGFALNVTCTPAPTCRKPSNFTVLGTTSTDAILSWTELGAATQWNIEYGPAGFTPGQGMTEIATTNPYTVTGLTTATAYDFYIQSDCGGGDVSEWSSVATATTDCDVIATFPYTENFDASTNLPDCWNNVNVTGDTEWEVSTPDEGSVVSAHSGSNAVIFYQEDEGDQADLQMPTFDLTSLTNPVLTFWYANESWSGDIDELTVYYRTSATDTWSQLTSHTSGVSTWTFDSLALPNPSATYQIKFHATSNYGYGIHIDDVTIMDANGSTPPIVTCDVPTNLAVSNITTTGATATWTAGGTETAWNLQYKAASAADWSNAIPVSAATYTFAGLTPNTQYQVRVQAACDATTTSDWTAAVSFTTVQESGDPCVAPSNLTVTDIHNNDVTLSWTENGTATSWTIYFRAHGTTSWTTQTVTTNPYTLTGLEGLTEYDFQVVSNCSATETSDPSNTITETTTNVGINDYVEANVTVAPNPTTGVVRVSSSKSQVSGVDVYDVYGKLLKTDAMIDNSTVDMSGYAAGVYFLRISTENGVVTKRVVKR